MTTAIERLRKCADADEYPPMTADIREVLADLDAWKASALKANREIGALRTALAYHGGAAALAMVDAAIASPAPESAVDALGYPLATCPACGEESRHYAFTMVVGAPDPNRYRCRNGHWHTPPPATPGDER